MRRDRVGFSMIEIMVVIAILVVLASTTFPRISRWRKNYDLNSAKASIAATIATTRAAAVQKGRPARVRLVGNTIRATVDTNALGSALTLIGPVDLQARYGVTVTLAGGTGDSIRYTSRGVLETLGATPRFYVANSGGRDSLCVSGIGLLVKKGCIQ